MLLETGPLGLIRALGWQLHAFFIAILYKILVLFEVLLLYGEARLLSIRLQLIMLLFEDLIGREGQSWCGRFLGLGSGSFNMALHCLDGFVGWFGLQGVLVPSLEVLLAEGGVVAAESVLLGFACSLACRGESRVDLAQSFPLLVRMRC